MPLILIFLKENHQILTATRSRTLKFTPCCQHLVSTFCRNSGLIQSSISPLLAIPHVFSLSYITAGLLQTLSHSLYTETAPWLQTPPLKLMSAAKFSLLQICISSIPAINPLLCSWDEPDVLHQDHIRWVPQPSPPRPSL